MHSSTRSLQRLDKLPTIAVLRLAGPGKIASIADVTVASGCRCVNVEMPPKFTQTKQAVSVKPTVIVTQTGYIERLQLADEMKTARSAAICNGEKKKPEHHVGVQKLSVAMMQETAAEIAAGKKRELLLVRAEISRQKREANARRAQESRQKQQQHIRISQFSPKFDVSNNQVAANGSTFFGFSPKMRRPLCASSHSNSNLILLSGSATSKQQHYPVFRNSPLPVSLTVTSVLPHVVLTKEQRNVNISLANSSFPKASGKESCTDNEYVPVILPPNSFTTAGLLSVNQHHQQLDEMFSTDGSPSFLNPGRASSFELLLHNVPGRRPREFLYGNVADASTPDFSNSSVPRSSDTILSVNVRQQRSDASIVCQTAFVNDVDNSESSATDKYNEKVVSSSKNMQNATDRTSTTIPRLRGGGPKGTNPGVEAEEQSATDRRFVGCNSQQRGTLSINAQGHHSETADFEERCSRSVMLYGVELFLRQEILFRLQCSESVQLHMSDDNAAICLLIFESSDAVTIVLQTSTMPLEILPDATGGESDASLHNCVKIKKSSLPAAIVPSKHWYKFNNLLWGKTNERHGVFARKADASDLNEMIPVLRHSPQLSASRYRSSVAEQGGNSSFLPFVRHKRPKPVKNNQPPSISSNKKLSFGGCVQAQIQGTNRATKLLAGQRQSEHDRSVSSSNFSAGRWSFPKSVAELLDIQDFTTAADDDDWNEECDSDVEDELGRNYSIHRATKLSANQPCHSGHAQNVRSSNSVASYLPYSAPFTGLPDIEDFATAAADDDDSLNEESGSDVENEDGLVFLCRHGEEPLPQEDSDDSDMFSVQLIQELNADNSTEARRAVLPPFNLLPGTQFGSNQTKKIQQKVAVAAKKKRPFASADGKSTPKIIKWKEKQRHAERIVQSKRAKSNAGFSTRR